VARQIRLVACFNPHPSLLTGEFVAIQSHTAQTQCFNPHPSLLTGEFQVLLNNKVIPIKFQSTPVIADG